MEKTLTKYEKELQELKPWDEVQTSRTLNIGILAGYTFISTAGHGYLVVPKEQPEQYRIASGICKYGFKGKLAVYLEEDSEISQFENVKN